MRTFGPGDKYPRPRRYHERVVSLDKLIRVLQAIRRSYPDDDKQYVTGEFFIRSDGYYTEPADFETLNLYPFYEGGDGWVFDTNDHPDDRFWKKRYSE